MENILFFLATSHVNFVCPPLFDRSIPVGSFIVAKVFINDADSHPQFDTAVLVACNYSSEDKPPEFFAKNNIFWGELTNLGIDIMSGHPE